MKYDLFRVGVLCHQQRFPSFRLLAPVEHRYCFATIPLQKVYKRIFTRVNFVQLVISHEN